METMNTKEWLTIEEAMAAFGKRADWWRDRLKDERIKGKRNGNWLVWRQSAVAYLDKKPQPVMESIPVETSTPPVDNEAIEQGKRIAKKKRDLEEKALDAGFVGLAGLRKKVVETNKLFEEAKQQKLNTIAQCETMVKKANQRVADADVKLKEKEVEVAQVGNDLKNVQSKIEAIISAKTHEADMASSLLKTESQARASRLVGEAKKTKDDAERFLSQARDREANAQRLISNCETLVQWFNKHASLHKGAVDILQKIILAIDYTRRYSRSEGVDFYGITDLVREYEGYTASLDIKPIPILGSNGSVDEILTEAYAQFNKKVK